MSVLFWLLTLAIAGCASRTPVPVTERPPVPPRPPSVAAPAMPVEPAPALPPAAAEPEVPTYVVKRGDSLGKIAADNAVSSRDLAAWNNIETPYLLRPGQVLRLRPPVTGDASIAARGPVPANAEVSAVVTAPLRMTPPIVETPAGGAPPTRPAGPGVSGAAAPTTVPSRATDGVKTEPKGVRLPYSEQAVAQLQRGAASGPATPESARARAATPASPPPSQAAQSTTGVPPPVASAPPRPPSPAPAAPATTNAGVPAGSAANSSLSNEEDSVDWMWPTSGKVLSGFSENGSAKGIDIAGKLGQPVVAVADGRVVYAGSGLRGYGKLIIIKHNKTYISAYAHNSQIHVKEGQQVTRGQRIADMGDTDADQVKLHFEIRRMGKPVDPSRYLPPG